MADHQIVPEKVTKPIQLLAAWLVGLIVVNASFLLAAQQLSKPEWASGLLVICSVLNVPIFIFALFLLQTKFRPQMQEDSYYSQYLERERLYLQNTPATKNVAQVAEKEIVETTEKIVKSLGQAGLGKEKPIEEILRNSQFDVLMAKVGHSRSLSELYKSPKTWIGLVTRFAHDDSFLRDVDLLLTEGLAIKRGRGYKNVQLTKLGHEVAHKAENAGLLFSQREKEFWESSRRELEAIQTGDAKPEN
jgi:hypothetical protein